MTVSVGAPVEDLVAVADKPKDDVTRNLRANLKCSPYLAICSHDLIKLGETAEAHLHKAQLFDPSVSPY